MIRPRSRTSETRDAVQYEKVGSALWLLSTFVEPIIKNGLSELSTDVDISLLIPGRWWLGRIEMTENEEIASSCTRGRDKQKGAWYI